MSISERVGICFRAIGPADRQALHAVIRDVGVFEPHEIDVAEELIADALAGSPDYTITVAQEGGTDPAASVGAVVGYACYGHNPVTDAVYDLYWIAIHPTAQGRGIGRTLLDDTERRIRERGGRGMTIETSSREAYAPARRLYERCGYRLAASIDDFYKPGDGLSLYVKFF